MTDLDRVLAHTTYASIQRELDEYSNLSEIDDMGIEAKLDAKITLLKNKIQARQLRHAYM